MTPEAGRRLLLDFDPFPEEAAVIGRLVVGYGELEYLLALLVSAAIGDEERAVRAIFRCKGETARIDVADALARPIYEAAGLGGAYTEALGAVRLCKTIRNQYAHSHWVADEGMLKFADIGDAAHKSEPRLTFVFKAIGNVVLNQQARWFDYTHHLLAHLAQTLARKMGQSSSPPVEAPPRVPRPRLNSSAEKSDSPNRGSAARRRRAARPPGSG